MNASLGGMLFSYAVSALLVCLGMTIGWMWKISEPQQVAHKEASVNTAPAPPSPPGMVFVGQITGLVDCTFSSDRDILPPPSSYAHVPLGRKYKLDSGLMEITYDTGAKVILQGPVTFEVESAHGGYLSVGKLTARVENSEAESGKSQITNIQSPISHP